MLAEKRGSGVLTAFDADVLIYAGRRDHPLGDRVITLFADDRTTGIGSVLLLTEVLAKPMREDPASEETESLISLLGQLELLPVDDAIGQLALTLAVRYGLRVADAVHLATAIAAGADRFLTNNRKDFPQTISEIDIVYPDELPAA